MSRNSSTVLKRKMTSHVCASGSPLGFCKIHGGEVIHDGNVDEALGLRDDAEDSLQVQSPGGRTEWWWGTLLVRHQQNSYCTNVMISLLPLNVMKVCWTKSPSDLCSILQNSLWGKDYWRHYPLSPAGGGVGWRQRHTLRASALAGSCWLVPSPSRTGRSCAGPLPGWSSCRSPLRVPSPERKKSV